MGRMWGGDSDIQEYSKKFFSIINCNHELDKEVICKILFLIVNRVNRVNFVPFKRALKSIPFITRYFFQDH